MKARGYDVKIVIEGSATKLVPELAKEGNPMYSHYIKAKEAAVSLTGSAKPAPTRWALSMPLREEGLKLLDDMNGHPGMARYRKEGFEVITF